MEERSKQDKKVSKDFKTGKTQVKCFFKINDF